MKIKIKLTLLNSKNEPFMGIGLVWLLERIRKFNSINKAAKDMNMSYSKALKILNKLEKNLGKKVITRLKGGNKRCNTHLTDFGNKFITEYNNLYNAILNFAQKEFKKFLKNIRTQL